MISQGRKTFLIVVALVALIGVNIIQRPIDFMRYDERAKSKGWYIGDMNPGDKKGKNLLFDLPVQFMGAAALGLREAVAGMLWVRADEFFHTGQYESILPIVRLCTWLDPKQVDIYTTGAWHMDYNFVDKSERSDRRYIPPAVKLLEEGVDNNPEIFDLYFELAWTHYFQKAHEYNKSIEWMKKAMTKPARDANTGKIVDRPAFVNRMLAHALEKAGRYDECEQQWYKCIEEAKMIVAKKESDSTEITIAQKNLGLFQLRRGWRYGDMKEYEKGLYTLSHMDRMDKQQGIALEAAKASFAKWRATGFVPHDTEPKLDGNFQVTWKKLAPRVIRVQGTLALAPAEAYKNLASEPYTNWYATNSKLQGKAKSQWRDGSRVKVMLVDDDYDYWNLPEQKDFSWELDRTQTVLWDETSLRNGKFDITIDIREDTTIYPLTHAKYRLVVWFNPQDAPDFIQDRIGWKGEGLTDKHYLNTKTNPGYRMLLREFILKKSDIM